MKYTLKKGFNWCSFDYYNTNIVEFFANLQKPLYVSKDRNDSGLFILTQSKCIMWNLEKKTVFGDINAKWSSIDENISYQNLYIIHCPSNCEFELPDTNMIEPGEKNTILIDQPYSWIGYNQNKTLDLSVAFLEILKPKENEEINIFSKNTTSTLQFQNQWTNNIQIKNEMGYIVHLPPTYDLPIELSFNIDSVVRHTFYVTVGQKIQNKVLNHSKNESEQFHPTDIVFINNKINPALFLYPGIYKFQLDMVSPYDQQENIFVITRDSNIESIAHDLMTRLSGDFTTGTFYFDTRNDKYTNMKYQIPTLSKLFDIVRTDDPDMSPII